MMLSLPRYVHGMLQTPDKLNVFGDIRPIAYSEMFSTDLQKQVYQKIRLGLNRELLKDIKDAYGFFALNDEEYIVAHFQLMELTEPTSRGKPVFSEYLYITLEQLSQINWNLYAIFQSFKSIDYYDQVNKNLENLEIDISPNFEWFSSVKPFEVHLLAVLLRFLSSSENINIVSAPNDENVRLKFFCALIQTIPERYRKGISFSTLASDTTESVRMFFSARQGRYGQIVDWVNPKIPTDQLGIVYTTWLQGLFTHGNQQKITAAINNLELPLLEKAGHLPPYGDQLGDSVKHISWEAEIKDLLKIIDQQLKNMRGGDVKEKILQQLNMLPEGILHYFNFHSDDEIADWLSLIFSYLIKLNAYDFSSETLAKYNSLINRAEFRIQLVAKIAQHTVDENENIVLQLAQFLSKVTELADSAKQSILLDFCKEILLESLSGDRSYIGLRLWVGIKDLKWVQETDFIVLAVKKLSISSKHDFIYFVENVYYTTNRKIFYSFRELLQRNNIPCPATRHFFEQFDKSKFDDYQISALNSFREIQSFRMFRSQINFALENYPDSVFLFPNLLEKIPPSVIDSFLDHIARDQDTKLIALITFSIIQNRDSSSNSSSSKLFTKSISFCQNCNISDINYGLSVVSGKWKDVKKWKLSSALQLLTSFLETTNDTLVSSNVEQIHRVLNQYERQEIIIKRSSQGVIDKFWLFTEMIPGLIRDADFDSWKLLVDNIEKTSVRKIYETELAERFIESDAFGINEDKLKDWAMDLENRGLSFESDLFTAWQIRNGDVFANINPALKRALKSEFHFFILAKIIGYKRAIDNNYMGQLLNNNQNIEIVHLRKDLQGFVDSRPIHSSLVRIQSIVKNISPEIIEIELCKTVLRQISHNTYFK